MNCESTVPFCGLTVTAPAPAAVVPAGYVSGFEFSFLSATQVTLGPGTCRSSNDTADIVAGALLTADIAVAGANGLDAGVEAADTWYAVHAIDGPAVATASLLSLSAIAPVLPAGYTVFRRIGWVRNDSGSNFLQFYCRGLGTDRAYHYGDVGRSELQVLAGGAAIVYTPLSLAAFVAPTSRWAYLETIAVGGTANSVEYRPTGSGLANGEGQRTCVRGGGDDVDSYIQLLTDTSQSVDYRNEAAGNSVFAWVYGYWDAI